jgi:hypothetical protein
MQGGEGGATCPHAGGFEPTDGTTLLALFHMEQASDKDLYIVV